MPEGRDPNPNPNKAVLGLELGLEPCLKAEMSEMGFVTATAPDSSAIGTGTGAAPSPLGTVSCLRQGQGQG